MNAPANRTSAVTAAIVAVLSLGACDAPSSGDSGEALFKKKCSSCHALVPGTHKIGPSLAGVIGRKAGSTEFSSYRALKGAEFIWSVEEIDKWIADPKAYIGQSTVMTVKIKDENDRKAIIDYLKAAGGNG